MQKQEGSHPDDYSVPSAASTCLMRVALHVGDEIVPLVLPFIEECILAADWHKREAAVLALGSIQRGMCHVIW